MIGQKLNNRYLVTTRLGKGAMGTVYRATDDRSGEEVALKVISGELAIEPEMLERFKREGEALRQLKHPNIVAFIDAFEHDDQYVIVMEYLPTGSLSELIRKGPMPVEQVRQISLDLCDALIRAHRLNIIHRDIKPENILIAQDGTPKLADFGVARLAEGTRMTRSGTQVGTPYYMSPEAWEGKALDAQADIWSLGVVMFEMLTGQVPFDGDTGPVVMHKVLTTRPPDLKKLRAEVPVGWVNILNRMLTRDKTQRYQTMREVAVDLERGGSATAPLSAKAKPALANLSLLGAGSIVTLIVICCVLGLLYVYGTQPAQTATATSSISATTSSAAASAAVPNLAATSPTLSNTRTARDRPGTQVTSTFARGDTVYVIADLRHAANGSVVGAVWYVVNATGITPNSIIGTGEVPVTQDDFSGDVAFHFPPWKNGGWPIGSYKIEIYLNKALNSTVQFTVQ